MLPNDQICHMSVEVLLFIDGASLGPGWWDPEKMVGRCWDEASPWLRFAGFSVAL